MKRGWKAIYQAEHPSIEQERSYQTQKRASSISETLFSRNTYWYRSGRICSDDLLDDSFSQYSIRKLVQLFNEKFSFTFVPLESKLKIHKSKFGTSNIVDLLEIGSVPLMEDAILTSRRVKIHTGRLYHLFDESAFLQGLYRFHSNWEDEEEPSRLWKCQYYLVLAFGNAFENNSNESARASSRSCFFERALSLLPGARACSEDPMTAIEVWCAIALYYQSLKEWTKSSVYVSRSSIFFFGFYHADTYRLSLIILSDHDCMQICRVSEFPAGITKICEFCKWF